MSDRRTCVLDAALRLLGRGGARDLTHRAVDAEAGLPLGTTSNHFRTRDALLQGALEHLADLEGARLAVLRSSDEGPGPDLDRLARDGAEVVRFLVGPARDLTLARHAIFLETAWRPELRPGLLAATQPFWRALEQELAALGHPRPADGARLLLACLDGIVLDQVLRPAPGFDAERAVRTLLRALLDEAAPAPDAAGAGGR